MVFVSVRNAFAILVGLSLGACGEGTESVSGRISLAADVRAADYTTLELRVVRSEADARGTDAPPYIDDALGDSERLTEIGFAFDYTLRQQNIGGNYVVAWLTNDPDSRWFSDAEPVGIADFTLCYCTSHGPAYAEHVGLTLEFPD